MSVMWWTDPSEVSRMERIIDRYADQLDRMKVVQHRRRTRLKGGGKHTVAEWRQLCEQANWRCTHCQQAVPLTADHIIPVCRGGSNTIDNIQPLCLPCNMRKGSS